MTGKGLRLYKKEKLRSVKEIDRLFAYRAPVKTTTEKPVSADTPMCIKTALVYPLRMVGAVNEHRGGPRIQFLAAVPKKRLRKAVDRAHMRRIIREAYRHVRGPVEDLPEDSHNSLKIDVAFIYVADTVMPYRKVLQAMTRLFETINRIQP